MDWLVGKWQRLRMPFGTQPGPGGAVLADELLPKVWAQQVHAVAQITQPMMLINLINASTLVLMLHLAGQLSALVLVWAAAAVTLSLQSLIQTHRRGSRDPPVTVTRRTVRRVILSAGIFGLIWAVPGVLILPTTSGTAQAFTAALLTGMIGGGAFALFPIPAAGALFVGLVFGGSALGLLLYGDPLFIGCTLIAFAFLYVFVKIVRRHSAIFVAEFIGREELEKQNRLISALLAEAQLEAAGEKQRSEHRLAQAQKIEAIGQLTAGIAHDFNNLLAAIQGNAELIRMSGQADAELTGAILDASQRGAATIQRLLSVARKQRLQPKPVALPRLIPDMLALLRGALGPAIRVETKLPEGLWTAHADPENLENALLNLAINARDAMPDGGTLTIACRNLREDHSRLSALALTGGGFIEISVRDTGVGMTPEIRKRALDPFFTTRKFGESSGLGLPMVAGFVRQSGGQVHIASAPHMGTTVSLYLPRAQAEPIRPRRPRRQMEPAVGDGEVILLVEDDASVLAPTARMLRGLNYRVISRSSAAEALDVLSDTLRIDLLLTDILLAHGETGFQLARRVHQSLPQLPVIFMSGFANMDAANKGDLRGPLLPKPFTQEQLAQFVRSALTATAAQ